MSRTTISPALILAGGLALTGEAGAAWVGNAEFGFNSTSGNTQTMSANLKLDLNRTVGSWRHNLFSEVYYSENDSVKSAERYLAGYKPSYFFSEKNYVFGMLRYDRDRFALISSRWNEIVGYGRQILNNDVHTLDSEIGVGARQTNYVPDPSTADASEHDTILFLGLKYLAKISETTQFIENARVESSNDNTFVESDTGLQMQVMGNLSAKVSYTVRYNSDITGARGDNTDTLTGVSLLYAFK